MTKFGTLVGFLSVPLLSCSSETAIVATLDVAGAAGASAGGKAGSGAGGAAGAIQSMSGGALQQSGGTAASSGGASNSSGGVGGGGAASGGAGGSSGGGVAGFGGDTGGAVGDGMTLDAGAGGILVFPSSQTYCSCSETSVVCDSDGVSHLCLSNRCPQITIICAHECPCGAGDSTVGNPGVWYPEECFDPSTCSETYFCVSNSPEGSALIGDCSAL